MNTYRMNELQDNLESFEIVTPKIRESALKSQHHFHALQKSEGVQLAHFPSKELKKAGLKDVYFEMKNNFCKEFGKFWEIKDTPFVIDFLCLRRGSVYHVLGIVQFREERQAIAVDWAWIHPFIRGRGLFTSWVELYTKEKPVFLTPPVSKAAAHVVNSVMKRAKPEIVNAAIKIVVEDIHKKRGVDFSSYSADEQMRFVTWSGVFNNVANQLEEAGANYKAFNEVANYLFDREDFKLMMLQVDPVEALQKSPSIIDLLKPYVTNLTISSFTDIKDMDKWMEYVARVDRMRIA